MITKSFAIGWPKTMSTLFAFTEKSEETEFGSLLSNWKMRSFIDERTVTKLINELVIAAICLYGGLLSVQISICSSNIVNALRDVEKAIKKRKDGEGREDERNSFRI